MQKQPAVDACYFGMRMVFECTQLNVDCKTGQLLVLGKVNHVNNNGSVQEIT